MIILLKFLTICSIIIIEGVYNDHHRRLISIHASMNDQIYTST